MRPNFPNELTIQAREGALTTWRRYRFRLEADPQAIERRRHEPSAEESAG